MDLIPLFGATLSPDANERMRAELALRQLESQDGLLTSVVHLVSNAEVDMGVKQAASIYLKNRLSKAWPLDAEDRHQKETSKALPAHFQDRQQVRDSLLPALTVAAPVIKTQLAAALGTVIQNDFPEKWPQLQELIMSGLNSSDENQVEASLIALLETYRKYRFALNERTVPNAVCEQTLPVLLNLGTRLLASVPQPAAPEPIGRLLHLIFKIYRISCQTELSAIHQQTIVQWGTLFLQVVNRLVSPADVPEDEELREKCEWWKAKKWAYFILNRLFIRYGSVSQLPDNMAQYKPFASNFEQNFAPEIFKAYLRQVELSLPTSDNRQWLSQRCQKLVVDFLEECVKPKSTWALLRPQLPLLISHFLFPLLCPTDDELSLFEDDPLEWVQNHFSLFSEDIVNKPEYSVLGLFDTLVACRKSSTLAPLVSFSTSVVSEYPQQRSAKEKEGALKIFHALARPICKTKPFNGQVEPFLLQHVLPDFSSPHGFLRARACQMVEKFEAEDMSWSDESNVNHFFDAISRALNDPALPVRIQAAIALPELFRYESLRTLVAPNIGNLMQELLKLANEVDLDALADTFRKLVDDFAEELVPYTEQLTASLAQSYVRMLAEAVENEKQSSGESSMDEKIMTAMNLIRTMEQLCSYVNTNKEILARLEVVLLPAICFTLEQQVFDLYDDMFDVIDTLLFYQKRISPDFWRVYELIYKSIKSEGVDYLDEMLGALDNFISYGSEAFAQNPQYLDIAIDIFETAMSSTALGAADRITACKLAESVLLNLRGAADRAIPIFVGRAMSMVLRGNTEEEPVVSPTLYLSCLQLVVNALFCNPIITVQFLDANGQTQIFFEKWQKKIKKFSRVHDRKLGIMALSSVLEAIAAGSLPFLADASSHLLSMTIVLFQGLPKAISKRLQMEKEMNEDEDEVEDIDDDDDFDAVADEAGDEEDFKPKESDLDAYLAREVARRVAENGEDDSDDEDDEWAEEVLFESPLDKMDAYVEFSQRLYHIQMNAPAVFEQATGPLTSEMREQLGGIGMLAQQQGEQGARQTAAAAVGST